VIGRNDPVPNNQCGITSLCHPWGAGVVKWLNEEVLGIKPSSPGFGEYSVLPHLGCTLTRVSGATPTPHGIIRVSFDLLSGIGSVSAPPGTVGCVGVPKGGRMIARIKINGRLAWDGRSHPVPGIAHVGADSEFVFFKGLRPGRYSFATTYAGRRPVVRPSQAVYACRLAHQDAKTGGDWGGVYGQEGYVLCGAGAGGTDVAKLPAYVESVSYFPVDGKTGRPETSVWAAATNERRALSLGGGRRVASCVYRSDQSMSMTIKVRGRHKFRVALYFLDWDAKGRSTAVEMFDADSLRILAPVALVSGFVGGKYLVFEYDRSVKFRFDRVRGDNPTVSGVFFDGAP
jgi:hypothetical protein